MNANAREIPLLHARPARHLRHAWPAPVRLLLVTLIALAAPTKTAACQVNTVSADSAEPHHTSHPSISRGVELVGALGLAATLDRPVRRALMQRGPDGFVTHPLSQAGNALGTANHLVPALAAAYLLAELRGTRNGPPDVLDAALGYAASDITAGAIRWAVGRERPLVHGDPLRFHPFTGRGDYHSFPSGHVTHIMAIATAVAIESDSRWARGIAAGTVGLVAWQRIHADQHWTSDVVGAAIISNLVSHEIVTRLRLRRRIH